MRATAYFYLFTTIFVWSSGYVLAKIPINEVSPIVSVFSRFAIVGFCSIFILGKNWSKLFNLWGSDHLRLITMGIMLGLYNWFYLEGLGRSTVMDSIFIESAFIPIFTIIATYFLKLPITSKQLFGLFIAIVGCFCFFHPLLHVESFSNHRFAGIFILFLSVIAWVISTFIGEQTFQRVDPLTATAYAMLVSSLFLLIIATKELPTVNWTGLSTDFWVTQVYLALFTSIIGNVFYSIGIKRVGLAVSSIFLFLVPVVGFFLAKLIVHESLSVLQCTGTIIMLIGIYYTNQVGKVA